MITELKRYINKQTKNIPKWSNDDTKFTNYWKHKKYQFFPSKK